MRNASSLSSMLALAGGCAVFIGCTMFVGCAMPVDGVSMDGDDASPLRFELEHGEDGLVSGVQLVNDGVEELTFGPASLGYQPTPRVFVEAQQADGEFVGRGRWHLDWDTHLDEARSLPPGAALYFPAGYGAGDLRPGDIKISLTLYAADGSERRVSRELGRTGWPMEIVDEALSIRRESSVESCTALTRTITSRLLREADADGIEQMSDAFSEPGARGQLLQEMLSRGGFVAELVSFVRDAPMDDVDDLVQSLSRDGEDVQGPVQQAASERLLEDVQNLRAELLAYRVNALANMHAHWPDDAPELLLQRLTRGPDEGYPLNALIRLFVSAQPEFHEMRPQVFRALTARCEGLEGDGLPLACQLAKSAYDPSSCGRIGLGGMSTSCRCGGAFSMGGPRCDALGEQWQRLTATAPALEDYALPSRVEDAVAQDDAQLP